MNLNNGHLHQGVKSDSKNKLQKTSGSGSFLIFHVVMEIHTIVTTMDNVHDPENRYLRRNHTMFNA